MDHNNEYNKIAKYISANEYILWRGKPEKGNVLTKNEIIFSLLCLVICAVLLCVYIFLFRYSGRNKITTRIFAYFIIGLYISVGRFFHRSYLRKRTYYVITNKKVIRLCKNTIDTIDGKRIHNIRMILYMNGCGTIRLGNKDYQRESYSSQRSSKFGMSDDDVMFNLENIANPAGVREILDLMDK